MDILPVSLTLRLERFAVYDTMKANETGTRRHLICMRTIAQRVLFNQEQYHQALSSLEVAVLEQNVNQFVKDATIQRYEYTYEMAWKLIKIVLHHKGIQLSYPREVLKEAFTNGWIDNPELWEDMIEDRNLTSHTYKARNAEQVYQRICKYYYGAFKNLQQIMDGVISRDIKSS